MTANTNATVLGIVLTLCLVHLHARVTYATRFSNSKQNLLSSLAQYVHVTALQCGFKNVKHLNHREMRIIGFKGNSVICDSLHVDSPSNETPPDQNQALVLKACHASKLPLSNMITLFERGESRAYSVTSHSKDDTMIALLVPE